MKKNIVSLLFIGFIAMISMSFQPSASGINGSGSGFISLFSIHGHADDGNWEAATFKLDGFNNQTDVITYVEVLNAQGIQVGEVDHPDGRYNNENNPKLYKVVIDLERYGLPSELKHHHNNGGEHVPFYLKIHILSSNGMVSTFARTTNATPPPTSPTDPDETILIVRYP